MDSKPGCYRRLPASAVLLLALALTAPAADAQPNKPEQDVLRYLDQTVDWYRRVTAVDPAPVSSQAVLMRDAVARGARDVVRRGFDFARAEADVLTPAAAPAPTTGKAQPNREQRLAQSAAAAAGRVIELRA